MKYFSLGKTTLNVSEIALGMMRIKDLSVAEVSALIQKAVALGINLFDHADIYGGSVCEKKFGDALQLTPELRSKIIIQTKCSIVPGVCYDASKEHILKTVDESLARLQCGYIDILLIHRPDALTDYKELGETFNILKTSGKVHHFGVSNMNRGQMELVEKFTKQPIVANQLQFSLTHTPLIDQGIFENMVEDPAIDRTEGALSYCMLNDITIQAWSVISFNWGDGSPLDNPKYPKINAVLDRLAAKYKVTKNAIAVAWVLRHPAHIQAIVGTTSLVHLEEISHASNVSLAREEWYELYIAAKGRGLP